jgi:hypothetical protein
MFSRLPGSHNPGEAFVVVTIASAVERSRAIHSLRDRFQATLFDHAE